MALQRKLELDEKSWDWKRVFVSSELHARMERVENWGVRRNSPSDHVPMIITVDGIKEYAGLPCEEEINRMLDSAEAETEARPENEFEWLKDTAKLIVKVANLNDVPFGTKVVVKDADIGTYALNWDWIKKMNNRWLKWALDLNARGVA